MTTREQTELAIGFDPMDLRLNLHGRPPGWDDIVRRILLPAIEYFHAQHGEQFSRANLIRKMALYYLHHADRYGLDENGFPKTEESSAAAAIADMRETLTAIQAATERHLHVDFDLDGKMIAEEQMSDAEDS
jgi:hypothetical protein